MARDTSAKRFARPRLFRQLWRNKSWGKKNGGGRKEEGKEEQ